MKPISQIIAGAQVLLNVSYELKGCFEEYLSDDYKTFLRNADKGSTAYRPRPSNQAIFRPRRISINCGPLMVSRSTRKAAISLSFSRFCRSRAKASW